MSTFFERIGRRSAAAVVLAAAVAGTGAFAPPAAAQGPAPEIVLDLDGPLVAGGMPRAATLDVAFDEDPADPLVMTLDIDAPDGTITFGIGHGCTTYDPSPYIECEIEDPGTANEFLFPVAAAAGTELGEYEYTLLVYFDATETYTETGTVEVVEHRYEGTFTDYDAADVAHTGVEPGSAVDVNPRFSTDAALPDDLYVTAVWLGPGFTSLDAEGVVGIEAPWDNCFADVWRSTPGGHFCFFTEFEDLPGTAFQFTHPIEYTVDPGAPGPLAVCACEYEVLSMDQATFERQYGAPSWDEGSSNLLGLTAAGDQDPIDGDNRGGITIETTDHPFDLTVGGAKIRGGEVELTIPIGNDGPAAATDRPAYAGDPSYFVRGQLPEGAALVSIGDTEDPGDDGWRCFDENEIEDRREALEAGSGLDRIDFACAFDGLGAGESVDIVLTVDVSDATGKAGRVEVDAFLRGVDGVNLDGDLANNSAALKIGGPSLPDTGGSTIAFVAAAAGALILGAVLFLVTHRRKEPVDLA
jgi:LPXTG-motif cell wall-anchored protein